MIEISGFGFTPGLEIFLFFCNFSPWENVYTVDSTKRSELL